MFLPFSDEELDSLTPYLQDMGNKASETLEKSSEIQKLIEQMVEKVPGLLVGMTISMVITKIPVEKSAEEQKPLVVNNEVVKDTFSADDMEKFREAFKIDLSR